MQLSCSTILIVIKEAPSALTASDYDAIMLSQLVPSAGVCGWAGQHVGRPVKRLYSIVCCALVLRDTVAYGPVPPGAQLRVGCTA
jgi:hypothetical protein